MTTNLEYCNFYSDKGWRVFPCGNDKKPMVKDWPNEATTDKDKILSWWSSNPDAGIGLATGKRSGIFAVDIDAGHGGYETLAKLAELPETVISNTGGGGRHYIFNYPPIEIRNSAGKLGQGIDCRAEGGYIIVPRSPHPSGHFYEWDKQHLPSQQKIADAPDWMLQALIAKQAPAAQGVAGQDGNVYPKGTRHAAMVSLAGSMRKRGMTEPAILAAILEEAKRFVPPATESDIQALKVTVRRVCNYEPTAALATQPRDRIASEWSFCKIMFEFPSEHVDFLDIVPEMFGEPQLREFYKHFLAGMSTAQAALTAGILAELEAYQDYYVPRIDDYANAIRNFSRYEAVAWLGGRLQKAAQVGDDTKISGLVLEIVKSAEPQDAQKPETLADVAEDVEAEIIARSKDPREVWGIAYPFPELSKQTGGKHLGELIMLAGEPGVGKSWLAAQDALYTALNLNIPVYYWSGEMGKKQTMKRLYALMGVNKRNMDTGYMTERDWDLLSDAKRKLSEIPLHIEAGGLHIHQLRPVLKRARTLWDIQEFIVDYATLIDAPGKDDTEKSAVVSRELKLICQTKDMNFAGLALSSVTKAAFDNTIASKAAMKGSGQQSHDADVIYFMTEFSQIDNDTVALKYTPAQHALISTLHIKKGRELEKTLLGNRLHLSRMNSPAFVEELQKRRLP